MAVQLGRARDGEDSYAGSSEAETILSPGTIQERAATPRSRQPSSLSSGRKYLFGLVIVLMIACSWVGSTQTAKSAFTSDFKAPFFLMWFGTAWMITLFPLSAPLYFLTQKKSAKDFWMLV